MRLSPHFQQRANRIDGWLPPRPRGSNLPLATGLTYEYLAGHIQAVNAAHPEHVEYKTFSFYFNNDIIWIYKSDATRHKVGDGSGNPRTGRVGDQGRAAEESEDGSDRSDDEDGEAEDWQSLKFRWAVNPADNARFSYATNRANHDTLHCQRRDQTWLQNVLPNRYLAPQAQTVIQPHGGVAGDLPILLALVAFSMRADRVNQVLPHCIGRAYLGPQCPYREGCRYYPDSLLLRC